MPAMENGQPPLTEKELVARAQRGDKRAVHVLVDRHAGSLFALAVSLVGNAADAEDLVQEALSGAFRGLGSFRGQSSVKTWLTRIIVRQAARYYRDEGRRQRNMESAPARPEGSSAQRQADIRMDVGQAIQALAVEHREVIVLRELQGLTYEEIAEVLGVPRGTVESRLFRARRVLQDLLKEYM